MRNSRRTLVFLIGLMCVAGATLALVLTVAPFAAQKVIARAVDGYTVTVPPGHVGVYLERGGGDAQVENWVSERWKAASDALVGPGTYEVARDREGFAIVACGVRPFDVSVGAYNMRGRIEINCANAAVRKVVDRANVEDGELVNGTAVFYSHQHVASAVAFETAASCYRDGQSRSSPECLARFAVASNTLSATSHPWMEITIEPIPGPASPIP